VALEGPRDADRLSAFTCDERTVDATGASSGFAASGCASWIASAEIFS